MDNIMNLLNRKKSVELKKFKDIKADVNNLNDSLNEENFISDFECKMRVRVKEVQNDFLTNIVYMFKREMTFQEKEDDYDSFELNLTDFNKFYNMVVSYNMNNSAQLPSKPKKLQIKAREEPSNIDNDLGGNDIQWNRTFPCPAPTRKSTSGKEGDICVICFSKPIQVVLPCLHGFCEDCCVDWYSRKNKKDCLMCRAPIGEGDWNKKIFEIMSRASLKGGNEDLEFRQRIVEFINRKARFVKIS